MIRKLFWAALSLVTITPHLSGQSHPAEVVGLYDVSGYSKGITPVLDAMKLPWRKITEEELKTPAVLKSFKVVAVIQGYVFTGGDEPMPNEVQQALTEYVKGGGRLYCDHRARPPKEVGGVSSWGEGKLDDLTVLSTDHPITHNLEEGQIIRYSLYGSVLTPSTAKKLAETTAGCSLIVNEYGKGVCVYSGVLLGAKNINNTGEPAMKQLISNIFAFLAEVRKVIP